MYGSDSWTEVVAASAFWAEAPGLAERAQDELVEGWKVLYNSTFWLEPGQGPGFVGRRRGLNCRPTGSAVIKDDQPRFSILTDFASTRDKGIQGSI
jgi:hypothetical protein